MMTRPMTALALVLSLCASACAEEGAETASETAAADTSAVQPAETGPSAAEAVIAAAPDSAWRTVDPEDLLRIETRHGDIWIELAPEFAPNHVARMRQLARQGWYDGTVWHRVIDDFMAQGGQRFDDPQAVPENAPPLQGEFTMARDASMEILELADKRVTSRRTTMKAGFWNGFQVITQPIAQAAIRADGRVEAFIAHCEGAAAAARTNDPNSARFQFYVTRAEAEHLNANYTAWGEVRAGQEAANAIKTGTLGQDMAGVPDLINSMRVAADLPEDEQPVIQVMDTNSDTFAAYLDALREENGGELPDFCEIEAPVRILEDA